MTYVDYNLSPPVASFSSTAFAAAPRHAAAGSPPPPDITPTIGNKEGGTGLAAAEPPPPAGPPRTCVPFPRIAGAKAAAEKAYIIDARLAGADYLHVGVVNVGPPLPPRQQPPPSRTADRGTGTLASSRRAPPASPRCVAASGWAATLTARLSPGTTIVAARPDVVWAMLVLRRRPCAITWYAVVSLSCSCCKRRGKPSWRRQRRRRVGGWSSWCLAGVGAGAAVTPLVAAATRRIVAAAFVEFQRSRAGRAAAAAVRRQSVWRARPRRSGGVAVTLPVASIFFF